MLFQQEVYIKCFQKWYSLLCDFWLKSTNFLKFTYTFAFFFAQKCWHHRKLWSQIFFWEFSRKFLWLLNFGTSFSFLTSLLAILRGASQLDPPSRPIPKKPSRSRVKSNAKMFGKTSMKPVKTSKEELKC